MTLCRGQEKAGSIGAARTGREEQRQHRRYPVRGDILVCHGPIFAEAGDISEAGLSCRYLASLAEAACDFAVIDLLDGGDKLLIKDIPCDIIHHRDEAISPLFPLMVLRRSSIRFGALDQGQKEQISRFIARAASRHR